MPDHKPTNPTGKNGRRQWTAADTERMRQLHADGMSCNGIAREMGFNPQVISRRCREEGLPFDRSRVEAANIARSVDAKARRQLEADRLHGLFDIAASQGEAVLEGKFKTTLKGDKGRERQVQLDFIPSNNFRELAAALTQLTNAAARLEAIDADNGNALGRSLLEGLAAAFGIGPVDHGDDADPA